MSASATAATGRAAQPVLGGARAWLVWCIAVAFVVFYFSFQTGYAISNVKVQADLGLTVTQVGAVAATYTWVFAIFQFISGPLLDRLGARRVLLPAIVFVTLGIFLFARAQSFGMLLLSQACFALGACAGFVGAGYVGGTWFGMAKFSVMFGMVQFAASLFSAFNQNLMGRLLDAMVWRDLFTAIATVGVVLLVVAALWLRDPVPVGGSIAGFLPSVLKSLAEVSRKRHVWVAAVFGALAFGVMLSLGVVWGPKLLAVRGHAPEIANLGSSLLWLGLAAGCFVAPWLSDRMARRKLPILVGLSIQLAALALLVYGPPIGTAGDMALCFAFGVGNSAHMLAFSAAADVVEPAQIGTSAAIVNGLMFVAGGILISRPGMRIGLGIESGLAPASLDVARFASRPLLLALVIAIAIAALMRETYPRKA